MANSGEISVALTPIQLYAMLNGKSISAGELASNSWHEMPGPPRNTSLSAFLQPMSSADNMDAIRRYLAGTGGSSSPNPAPGPTPYPTRADAWSHQSHYSQPNAPDCWIPPAPRSLNPTTINRAFAVVQIIGGGAEEVAGVLLIFTPEPTMLTKIGGAALTLHGADVMQAATRQLFSGKPVADYTQQSGTWVAKRAGMSDRAADLVGIVLDVGIPLAVGAALGVSKLQAIRQGRAILSEQAVRGKVGRITIAEEEADLAAGKEGGHTDSRHVKVNDDDLLDRAMASKDGTKVFSRFLDSQAAEDAINDCVRGNRKAMQDWARNPTFNKEFEFDLGRPIGRGFFNTNGKFAEMTKVRVVLKVAKTGPKSFYIITAYPIP